MVGSVRLESPIYDEARGGRENDTVEILRHYAGYQDTQSTNI